MTDEKRNAFKTIFSITKSHEGGYVDSPHDKGGETYCGISRRAYPEWGGWFHIDTIKSQRQIKWNEVLECLDESVVDFYYENIWKRFRIDEVRYNQDLIFDMFVNHSYKAATKLIWRSIVESGIMLSFDGVMGSDTIAKLNRLGEDVRKIIIDNRIKYYQSLNDPIHIGGWLKRARSFI